MKTLGTLFTGFGGFDIGAHAAGLTSAWGIEYDAAIADVGRMNGLPVQIMDVMSADPMRFEPVGWLHASPPCPNFSAAKAGAVETTHDLALAAKTAEFVTTMRPAVFSLENVRGYEKSKSFQLIVNALMGAGYWPQWSVINSADMGVPQTRERLILRATRDQMPGPLPEPVGWVGWYAAIEDLIDTLPDSKFADWQLQRLPKEITESLLCYFRDTGFERHQMAAGTPSCTIRASEWRPSHWRAFLVERQGARSVGDLVVREALEPAWTMRSRERRTEAATALIGEGRIVGMTPRALARFQSFPDSYQLPDNKGLACKGIGNAVPSLLAQRIVEATL